MPTPPDAITGTSTASATARVSARSKPSRVPSRSMLVSRISPAPASAMRCAHSTASRPVALRPPWVKTSQPAAALLGVDRDDDALGADDAGGLAHQLRVLHRRGVDRDLVGAGVEQPAHVVDLRTPPPTVSGMKTCSATASITCSSMSRSSELAVMSRNVSSSAPSPS